MEGFKIKLLEDGSADIYITGLISDDEDRTFFDVFGVDPKGYVFPCDVKEQLKEIKGKPLNVYINSEGGSVQAGLSIANMLSRHDAPVTGYIDGWAASMAGVIFLSCKKRIMPANTFLMLHRPSVQVAGNVDTLLEAVDFLDRVNDSMMDGYKKCLRNEKDFDAMKQNCIDEKWYTAKEASEMFDIELKEEQFKAAACAGTDVFARFPNAPKALKEMKYYQKPKNSNKEMLKNKIYTSVVLSRTI
jgi:ATP-dependent protease ClpP protease subunit